MDNIYIKIYASENNEELDEIREAGLLFSTIATSLFMDRDDVKEIDETNYLAEIKKIKNKFKEYDKS